MRSCFKKLNNRLAVDNVANWIILIIAMGVIYVTVVAFECYLKAI